MSTKIKVSVFQTLRPMSEHNKVVVVLKHNTVTENFKTYDSVKDLYQAYTGSLSDDKLKELQQVEYLLMQGVTVVLTQDTTLTTWANHEWLDDIKFVVLLDETKVTTLTTALNNSGIEVYVTETDYATAIGVQPSSIRNLVISFGQGVWGRNSLFATETGGKADDVLIQAGVAVVARKVQFLENDTPYLPVAGEDTGVFRDFVDVKPRINFVQREELQKKRVNPMVTKQGVGVHMVAQNTRLTTEDTTNPLARSHANTLTNVLALKLRDIGDRLHSKPNNIHTWQEFELEVKAILNQYVAGQGIETYRVITGTRLMSEADIANGIFRARVSFLPVRVIEEVELNLVVHDSEQTLVQIEGVE